LDRGKTGMRNWNIENLKKDRDVEGLTRLLENEDYLIRKQAVLALEEIGDASCVLPIARRFQDTYMEVRNAACATLVKIGSQAVEPLIEVLKDQNWIVREGAVEALEKIRDTRAIYPLIEALKDTNTKKISNALRSIGPAAFEPLIEALKNEDSRIRMGAAMVLGEMKNPAAIDSLVKITKDEDHLVRQLASSAIHMIKHENHQKKRPPSKPSQSS
jgi:HEAT repeat protein